MLLQVRSHHGYVWESILKSMLFSMENLYIGKVAILFIPLDDKGGVGNIFN